MRPQILNSWKTDWILKENRPEIEGENIQNSTRKSVDVMGKSWQLSREITVEKTCKKKKKLAKAGAETMQRPTCSKLVNNQRR